MNDRMLDPAFTWTYDEAIAAFRVPYAFEVRATYTFDNQDRLRGLNVRRQARTRRD